VITSDFGHLPKDLGEFQFIALHGVFSWVSQEVRDEILRWPSNGSPRRPAPR